ncbi:hypothetical protein ACFWNE_28795, partial [Streptomyces goshikiensis]|uniref:hypothetical protein n=1 Tax=Streptomyces goshikiensis TaxID=1942 RepID=UPI0036609D2A
MNVPRSKTALLLAGSVLTVVLPFAAAAPAAADTSMTITGVVLGSSNSVTVSGQYACDGEGYPSSVGVTVDNLDFGRWLGQYLDQCSGGTGTSPRDGVCLAGPGPFVRGPGVW